MMRFCAVAALILVACRGQVTAPKDLVEVTSVVSPAAFRVGNIVTVTVTVINHASFSWVLQTNTCSDAFEVTIANGTVVGPAPRACGSADFGYKGLAPGDRYVFTQQWSGDAKPGDAGTSAVLLAGTYLVRGLAFPAAVTDPPAPPQATIVNLSATIQILP
jgi:hypothetical protein